jgi:hypothetical protein
VDSSDFDAEGVDFFVAFVEFLNRCISGSTFVEEIFELFSAFPKVLFVTTFDGLLSFHPTFFGPILPVFILTFLLEITCLFLRPRASVVVVGHCQKK